MVNFQRCQLCDSIPLLKTLLSGSTRYHSSAYFRFLIYSDLFIYLLVLIYNCFGEELERTQLWRTLLLNSILSISSSSSWIAGTLLMPIQILNGFANPCRKSGILQYLLQFDGHTLHIKGFSIINKATLYNKPYSCDTTKSLHSLNYLPI